MNHHENIPSTDKRIKHPLDAFEVAEAEQSYRELEIHAKQLGLGHVALDMARQATDAGDAVLATMSPRPRIFRPHEQLPSHHFEIVTRSFEAARHGIRKEFSDAFIDGALAHDLKIGENRVFTIKSYFDNVPMTPEDNEVARSPQEIAALYRETSEVVLRNLNVIRATNASPERIAEISAAKQSYEGRLAAQIPHAEQAIIAWCSDNKVNQFPVAAVEYQGFGLNGQALMNSRIKDPSDVAVNIKTQREIAGTFIMAYSNNRMLERKGNERTEEPDRRIYLNPNIKATPLVFEQILQMANEKGLTLQLKMIQRATELASEHQKMKDPDYKQGTLRGDGIVIYLHHNTEDQILDEVLKIVEQNAEAFRGRDISKIPTKIAEGVAIGDEPIDGRESLTSHRTNLISQALNKATQAGLKGAGARRLFRTEFQKLARSEHVNPQNFAFNA